MTASRIERVNPVLMSHWVCKIDLSPSGDEWFETEMAPDLIINVEGNFDTFFEANNESIGTVWNAWQTTWSGVVATTSPTVVMTDDAEPDTGRPSWSRRSIQTIRTDQTRTGIQTDVVAQIDL